MKKPSLSIVIPVYNEENSLDYVIQDALNSLPSVIGNYEIIIINDGSTDKTKQIAHGYAKKSRRVHLYNQKHNGFSKALQKGIKKANKEYVAYMQGDGQDLVRDMLNCFDVMHQYDLVLGIRGRRIDYDFYRLMLSYGCLMLYRILFNIKYEDVHWIYVWRTREVKKLKLDPNAGVFTLVETLIKFREKGLSIGEATSPYRPRYAGVSKNTSIDSVYLTLKSMLKLKWKMIRSKK